MLHLPLLIVPDLGRVHMPIEFSHQIRNRPAQSRYLLLVPQCDSSRIDPRQLLTANDKVIHRVDVFQEFACREVSNSCGLPG